MIDTGDAEEVVGLYMEGEKADFTWEGARTLVPKNRVKLLLNLVLLGLGAVPRGGNLGISIEGEGEGTSFTLRCTGPKARVPSEFVEMLNGHVEGEITAHGVQPYYTILLANDCGLALSATTDGEDVVLKAA